MSPLLLANLGKTKLLKSVPKPASASATEKTVSHLIDPALKERLSKIRKYINPNNNQNNNPNNNPNANNKNKKSK